MNRYSRRSKRTALTVLGYAAMFTGAFLVLLASYTAIWFSTHDSIYAPGCPEQKTVFFCKTEKE